MKSEKITEIEIQTKSLAVATKQTLIKRKLLEWTESSTLHGLSNLFKTEIILLRVIWLVCILCSVGFCAYLIM